MTTRPEDERPRRRAAAPLAGAVFALTAGFNLLLGEWLSAAFFLVAGFVFVKHREIDRRPKGARLLATLAVAALAAAMFVRLVLRLKGGG